MIKKITVSVLKADVGSMPGHTTVHPKLIEVARGNLLKAKNKGMIVDYYVTNCGDDLELIMTHTKGIENKIIHKVAWDTFIEGANVAKSLKLYGAGQDILSTAFSGNLRGLGPGICEMEFVERGAEPLIIFMADKTEPGAWNMPLYKMFADPFNTVGLVIDPKVHPGFTFEVQDVKMHKKITLKCPEEIYDLLVYIGAPGRYCIKRVYRNLDGEIAAVSSTERLGLMAGKYVGKDDPACMVRAQSGFPAVGEILEPFSFPHLVGGWMRGSHHGPLMPVGHKNATPTRFDGPPRVIAMGFLLNNGILEGPFDLFNDPAFDLARQKANEAADYMRRHGPFEPHRLGLEDMEYTTLGEVEKKLKPRWKKI
jgi:fructose 1,6-bisphosphate aldolase/phosphatase